jgi:hypothetical protein
MKKFRIQNFLEIILAGKVGLRDFEGLLKEPLLQLDQVPVIPGKDGDLEIRVGYFTDEAHNRQSFAKCNLNPV